MNITSYFNRTDKIKTKLWRELAMRAFVVLLMLITIASLFVMFFFILKAAIPAYQNYGFFHMYFTADFTKTGGYGIWGPLFVTLFTSIIAVLIATPVALRIAIFINFRLLHGKRFARIMVSILGGVPSIVWGVFSLKSLPILSSWATGISNGMTIYNSVIMLFFMVTPTMTLLISNQLQTLPKNFIGTAVALGQSRTGSIYRLVKREIRSGIYAAIVVSLGRAVGETMALSLLLITAPSGGDTFFTNGFDGFLKSSPWTLSVSIANLMFTDSGGNTSFLFAAGIAMFIILVLMIGVITRLSKKRTLEIANPIRAIIKILQAKDEKTGRKILVCTWKILIFPLALPFYIITRTLHGVNIISQLIFDKVATFATKSRGKPGARRYSHRANSVVLRIESGYRLVLEVLFSFTMLAFVIWFLVDIINTGARSWEADDFKYTYFKGRMIVGGRIINPIVWTLILIVITTLIAFPLALATTLYLTEYNRRKQVVASVKFFVSALGGTPSIIFGIFGVIFFIETLGIRSGHVPYSFMAGALTIMLVILPNFIYSIEEVISRIPKTMRYASYALGATKIYTIFKIILPQAAIGIVSGVVISAGRIIAETAPVYLTLGYSASNPEFSFIGDGHTITTRIWDIYHNQIGAIDSKINAMYALAATALILTMLITAFAEVVEPLAHKISRLIRKIKIKMFERRFKELRKLEHGR